MTKSKVQTLRNKKSKRPFGELNDVFLVGQHAAELRVRAYARFRGHVISNVTAKYVFDNVGPLVGKKKKGWSMMIGGSQSDSVKAQQSA